MRIATTGDIGHWLAMTGFWARSTAQVRRVDRNIRPYEVRGREYDRVGGREGCPTEAGGVPVFLEGKNSKNRTFVFNFLFTYYIIVVQ